MCFLIRGSLDILGLESLEGGNVDVGDQSVEFVGRVLVFVTEASKADAHTEGNITAKEKTEKWEKVTTNGVLK